MVLSFLLLWFISAGSSSASVELRTKPQVETRCGQNVTLSCNAVFSNQQEAKIFKFQWNHENRDMCEDKDNDQFHCERTNKTSHQELTLILPKIKLIHAGRYLCKIHTNLGIANTKADVVIKDCFENSTISMNVTHAECSFTGIYPSGDVHWFQGDANITDEASSQKKKNHDGFYDFQSTVDMEKRNLSQPLNCSLWIPSTGKYVINHQLKLRLGEERSSGSTIKLLWVCVVVEIIMMRYWI